MIETLIAKLALGALWGRVKTNAAHDWQAIPPKWRKVLLIALAAVAAFFLHQWYAHRVTTAADKAGYARARAEDRAELDRMRAQLATAGAAMAKMSQTERTKNDAANRDIHAAAASLSLQGPGAASCSRRLAPAVPAAAGGPIAADQPTSPAPTPMPAENGADPLAVVSWRWLVGTGEQCDLERAENISWRNAYAGWTSTWEKLRNGIQSPNK